jgi:hypothetical protein
VKFRYIFFILDIALSFSKGYGALAVPNLLADNLPPLPAAGADPQSIAIHNQFALFVPYYRSAPRLLEIYNDANAIKALELSIATLRDPTIPLAAANSTYMLNLLTSMQRDIRNFMMNQPPLFKDHIYKNLEKLRDQIADRYGLAKIEDAILNGYGLQGQNTIFNNAPAAGAHNPNIPDALANPNRFRDTIHQLTGRIFVVQTDAAGISRIISKSSGMIIPRAGPGPLYDTIITCCHSMKPLEKDPTLQFYFVRSEVLDLNTGLPTLANIRVILGLPASHDVTEQDFIRYLHAEDANHIASNAVRRIINFTAHSHANQSILNDHAPRYRIHEDCGEGHLSQSFALAGPFASIIVLNALPSPANTNGLNNDNNYYAIGYPGFRYYDVLPAAGALLDRLRYAPLIITKPSPVLGIVPLAPQVINQQLRHHAPTMKGMSGGPIVKFNPAHDTIYIMGVIGSGNMDINSACMFT